MQVVEAKTRVLAMMRRDLLAAGVHVDLDERSPDPRDPGKFMLAGFPARTLVRFSGWFVYLGPDWFDGLFSRPVINRSEFTWYVFHIPRYAGFQREHYFVCDYQQVRDWVLEFAAPLGRDHRDHIDWRASFERLGGVGETEAYFRWGDEPRDALPASSRVVSLDNVAVLSEAEHHVGRFALGGESAAHRLLKLYLAERPTLLGLSPNARPTVEYPFLTGDRVDLLFDNHAPHRSVVEVEVEGERQLIVGLHQAIKYRSLASSLGGYPLSDPRVRAYLAAYETRYPAVQELAQRYDVRLLQVDRREVLRKVA